MEKINIAFVINGKIIGHDERPEEMEYLAMEAVKKEISDSLSPIRKQIISENGNILLIEDRGEITVRLSGFSEELSNEILTMLKKF